MGIHLVRLEDRWVLERLSRNICQSIESVTAGQEARRSGVNVYLPYYLMQTKTEFDVCLFTHLELYLPDKIKLFEEGVSRCDLCWAMSHKTAELLPEEKTFVLELPADPLFQKEEVVLGFSGNEKPSGRKNFSWIRELSKVPGVRCLLTGGRLRFEKLLEFYRKIDYLVITSNCEGGPLPVKEAISFGVPVIAPDVGWCWEYPVIRYTGFEELLALIERLFVRQDRWQHFSRDWIQAIRKAGGDTSWSGEREANCVT